MLLKESLDLLHAEFRKMTARAEEILEKAIATFDAPDEAAIQAVRDLDKLIDEDEIRIDNLCMEMLALQEPYAVDFRYIFSIAKAVLDLERVGDQSKTIARWSRKLKSPPGEDMRELARKSQTALRMAIEALIEGDTALAKEVMDIEFQVDELEEHIIENTTDIAEAFTAKALERVGDLATNLAEKVYFSVNAAEVRHGRFMAGAEQ